MLVQSKADGEIAPFEALNLLGQVAEGVAEVACDNGCRQTDHDKNEDHNHQSDILDPVGALQNILLGNNGGKHPVVKRKGIVGDSHFTPFFAVR
ncbi:hypothetical protein D3C74_329900 [compost metagenome]